MLQTKKTFLGINNRSCSFSFVSQFKQNAENSCFAIDFMSGLDFDGNCSVSSKSYEEQWQFKT